MHTIDLAEEPGLTLDAILQPPPPVAVRRVAKLCDGATVTTTQPLAEGSAVTVCVTTSRESDKENSKANASCQARAGVADTESSTTVSCLPGLAGAAADQSFTIDLPAETALHPERARVVVEAVLAELRGDASASEASVDTEAAAPPPPPLRWPGPVVGWRGLDESVTVLQPRVAKQWHPNACGHHALHNALQLLAAAEALARGAAPPRAACAAMASEAALWRRACRTVRALRARWAADGLTGMYVDECHMRQVAISRDLRLISALTSALISR
jgi:hypothetical protein